MVSMIHVANRLQYTGVCSTGATLVVLRGRLELTFCRLVAASLVGSS